MSVYIATYREPNSDRISQISRLARQFHAGFLVIESREDLVNNMVALGMGPAIGQHHTWVPLELDARSRPLAEFEHPENVVYVLGSQIGTIPRDVLDLLDTPVFVETPPIGSPVLPTPVVAGIVLHHRLVQEATLGELNSVLAEQGA